MRRQPRAIVAMVLATAVAVVGIPVLYTPSAAAATNGAPTHLTTEYRTNPLGVDLVPPRFGWWVNDSARGAVQSAYEIQVSTSDAFATTVWSTGKVNSNASTQVTYAGATLSATTRYFWRVRSWGNAGQVSPWSAVATFETGLANWTGAAWMAARGLLRGTLTVTGTPVASARLYVAPRGDNRYSLGTDYWAYNRARGVYQASVNGSPVTNTTLEGSRIDTRKRVYYRTYDVTSLVTAGTNVVGINVAEFSDVRAVLIVRHTDGTVERLNSGAHWWNHAGPVVAAERFYGERYDARLETLGWDTPGFLPTGWVHPPPASEYAPYTVGGLSKGRPVSCSDQTAPDKCDNGIHWVPASLTDGDLTSGAQGGGLGYHAADATSADTIKWVQVDLGAAVQIGEIMLSPAGGGSSGLAEGFGFPLRYRVEVSNDSTFASGVTVVADRTGADEPNPGANDPTFATNITARYVRITATRLYQYGTYKFALAELSVKPLLQLSASDEVGCCGWTLAQVSDGVRESETGFHAKDSSTAVPNPAKWVQIDLTRTERIGQVTLYPARNLDFGEGFGFPQRYRVQVCADAACANPQTVVDRTGADQPSPGLDPVTMTFPEVSGRYVRLVATKLATEKPGGLWVFAMGEIGAGPAEPEVPMVAQPIPPITASGPIAPVRTTQVVPGVWQFDFGSNMAGATRLRVQAPAGTTVSAYHGEVLDANGRVTTANIWAAQTNRYTTKGSGVETWTPGFVYVGFRYVEVSGLPGPPAAGDVVAIEMHNDVTPTGSFTSANPLLTNIDAAMRQTVLSNLHGVPEDCPTREKRGWLADAYVAQASAMNGFDMAQIYSEFSAHMADAQIAAAMNPTNAGLVPDNVPPEPGYQYASDPAWAVAVVTMPWELYQRLGDRTVLARNYTTMKNWVEFERRMAGAGLLITRGSWLTEFTEGRLYRSAMYYLALDILTKTAGLLGEAADQATYAARAEEFKTVFNDTFLKDRGTPSAKYVDAQNTASSLQLANALPLYAGMVPAGDVAAVVDALVKAVQDSGNRLPVPTQQSLSLIITTKFVPAALQRYQRTETLYAMLTQTTYASWGYMLAKGPGTIWEVWDADEQLKISAGSRNHPALGSPTAWFYEGLAGIQPDPSGPGYKKSLLVPSVPTGLNSASATVTTPYGPISSAWNRSGNGLTYTITVPTNTTATVSVPRLGGQNVTIAEGGTTIYNGGAATGTVTGVTYLGTDTDAVRYTVGSGTYTFSVTVGAAVTSLAAGKTVTTRSTVGFTAWRPSNLTDGITLGGGNGGAGGSEGYHSTNTNTDPNQSEWAVIDLGGAQPIAQVKLFPAHPQGYSARLWLPGPVPDRDVQRQHELDDLRRPEQLRLGQPR